MKKSNFTYYMHDGPAAFSFELAGALSTEDAAELEQAWRTASSVIGDRTLVVDLSFVTAIDEGGRALLRKWHESGAQLVAKSPEAQSLAESMVGAPVVGPPPLSRTYEPFFTQFTRRFVALLIVLVPALLHPVTTSASALPECWTRAGMSTVLTAVPALTNR
jgi:ABC-type transporter Mla MlaB component